MERSLRLHLLSSAIRVQPVRRPGTQCAASRQPAQRRWLGSCSQAGRDALLGKVSRIYFRADAAFGPPFRLREVSIAVRTLRLSCRKAGKAPIFTPVRESSGESRIKGIVD
jgi:hypothetical protein